MPALDAGLKQSVTVTVAVNLEAVALRRLHNVPYERGVTGPIAL